MDRNALYDFIAEDNTSDRYDDLLGFAEGGPVGEEMQSEVEPSVQYYAEGGSVDERGLFSQQMPQRPQQLRRTAAEMLQKMPQVQMGTMRFSPLTMPGVSGRPVQQFAEGGEVGGMTLDERQRIDAQTDQGAPVDNLFGANLAKPAAAQPLSFETNIPTFTPTYTPPTGPVTATGSALSAFPTSTVVGGSGNDTTQFGTIPTFKYSTKQQATPAATAKSLYDQITPTTLAAAPYDFRRATGTLPDTSVGAKPGAMLGTSIYTPTEQTFTKPVALTAAEALLKQPVLTRYQPNIKYGGLQTYMGPLQTEANPPEVDETSTGTGTGTAEEDSTSTGTGGGLTAGTINWLDAAKAAPKTFSTGNFAVGDVPKVKTVEEVFALYGGTGVLPQFKAEGEGFNLIPNLLGYKDAKYGWDGKTQSYNITPTALKNILQTKSFMTTATNTVNKLLEETGYVVGGKKTDGIFYSAADRDALVKRLLTGATDVTRIANEITQPLRSTNTLSVTQADTPTLFTVYRNAGVIKPVAASGGTGTNTAGTNTAGTTPVVTNNTGTNTAGTNTAGTNTAGTNTAGTNTAGTTTAGTTPVVTNNTGTTPVVTNTAGTNTAGTTIAQDNSGPFPPVGYVPPVTSTTAGGTSYVPPVTTPSTLYIGATPAVSTATPAVSTATPAVSTATTTAAVPRAPASAAEIVQLMRSGALSGGDTFTQQAMLKAAVGSPLTSAEAAAVASMEQYRAEGSPPEGEYADPVEAIRERQRMRREMGTMDQGSARDRLKKFLGGEDLTPVQEFGKGGVVKKAAELLKGLGVSEGKVAGKELTTLQDAHTSLGDRIRERSAKMQQQMDAMDFKYNPGQYVFTEGSAKNNRPPLIIKAKQLYGNQPMREPHPENPLLGKVIKDPATGRATRTPYEPGYLVRREGPEGQWSEFVIPQSAIKGSVDDFAHGGMVHRAEGSPVQGEKVDRANQPITTPDGYEISPSFGDRMGANVSDFLINAGTKAASLFPADETKLSAAHRLFLDTFGVKENRAPVTKEYFNQEELDALTDLISRKGGKKGSIVYKDYETLMGDRPVKQYHLTSGRLDPYISISKSLGQFNYEYDPKTGNYKILDEYDFNPKVLKSGVSSESNFIGDYIGENHRLIDKLRLYAGRKLPPGTGRKVDLSVPAKKAVKRAEGSPVYGEMADTGGVTPETIAALRNRQGLSATEALNALKKIYGEGISNAESALRGSAAAIPGAFGDIESLFRDSDKTRKLATTEEVLRDYMPKRVTKPTKEAAGFEEVGTYLPLPIPTSAVKKAGAVAKTGARKALEELGPTAAGMAERQLQKSGLGPMYAVKPGGGTFFPPEYGAQLDDYLDRVVKDLSSSETLAGKDAKTVADFIRTKGRNYLTTTYGTSNDPLRAALSEGRLPRYGSDKERFRKYLLKAAEEGDPEALEDLERFYDTASGVDAIAYVPTNKQARDFEVSLGAQDAMRKRMAAEGVEPEFMNQTFPSSTTKEQLEASYSTQSRKNLAELMRLIEDAPTVEEKQRKLTALGGDLKSLSYAAEKGEPIYDVMSPSMDFMNPRNVAQGIASIPVADLERMSFPEAVIKGSQNMRLTRDWESVIKNAETGKRVPKDIFFTGTNPVYELDKSKQWVRIMTPDAVELEGAAMHHSIGGYKTSNSYNLGGKDAFNSGLARIFSLRNEKGVPQVTIETKFTDEGGLEITRGGVRSKFNSEPTAAEKSAVFQLFDTLGPKVINPTKYTVSRAGDSLDEATTIDWGQEYADYLKYKNKGEEINNANR